MKTQAIIEALDLTEAQLDLEQRTARQVIIKAGRSKNGRVYSDKLLQDAAPKFEGVQTYANHMSRSEKRERPERSTRDITGWLSGVEYREGALYATRHFARTQAGQDMWALVEDVVSGKAPASLVGASIHAVGTASRVEKSDDWIVESIERVLSVDDVTTPAAGGGFIAESAGDEFTLALLENMTFEEWFEARPEYRERHANELKKVRQTAALKAAKADAEASRQALQEAQEQNTALEADVTMLTAEVEQLRRDLTMEAALRRVNLPSVWEESLRSRLEAAPLAQWAAIIADEKAKASASGATRSRVNVQESGVRVHRSAVVRQADSTAQIRRKLAQAQTPEEQLRLLTQLNEVKS